MRQLFSFISIILIIGSLVSVAGSLSDHNHATTIMQQIHAYIGIFGSMTVIGISLMSLAICTRLDQIIENSAREPAGQPATEAATKQPDSVEVENPAPKIVKSPVW